jgi:hypothetical protein
MKPEAGIHHPEEFLDREALLEKWRTLLPDFKKLLELLDQKEIFEAHNRILKAKNSFRTTATEPTPSSTSHQLTLIHLDDPDYAKKENELKNSIADFKKLLEAHITQFATNANHQIPELALALDLFCTRLAINPVPLNKLENNLSTNALKLGFNLADITHKLEFFIEKVEQGDIILHRKLRPGEPQPQTRRLPPATKTTHSIKPVRRKRKHI